MESSRPIYASITKRSFAFLIDDIIVSLLFIAIYYDKIVLLSTPESLRLFLEQNLWVLLFLKIAYHTFFIGLNGQTIGKYLVKIKAVDENDFSKTISWNKAFLRAVVRTIGEMLFYFTFIVAFFDEKRQTLHDKIGKCVVINV